MLIKCPSIRILVAELNTTRSPSEAILPSTLTRPAAITSSNSRREPCPARAKIFCNFSPKIFSFFSVVLSREAVGFATFFASGREVGRVARCSLRSAKRGFLLFLFSSDFWLKVGFCLF